MTPKQFLQSTLYNAWVDAPNGLYIYMRKNKAYKGTLDLATLTNDNPGHGALGAFITPFEVMAKSYGFTRIYVENVLNVRLRTFFEKHNYSKIKSSPSQEEDFAPCYDKIL